MIKKVLQMPEFAKVCEQAARAGGDVLLGYRGQFAVREKAPADLVTEADVAAQEAIRELVLGEFPDHDFLGEEDDPALRRDSTSEFTWIVDPLDGTTNYVHGLENYCVSVALQHHVGDSRRIIEGVIFDPVRSQCFRATLGKGAYCNNEPIRVSDVSSVEQALVAASLPARVKRDSGEVERFVEVLYRSQAIRRLGSAALNLCYVASGRLDAYWATSVKTWDVAAGLLLVQEAGGCVTDLNGQEVNYAQPKFVVTGTESLHAQMLELLAETTKEG